MFSSLNSRNKDSDGLFNKKVSFDNYKPQEIDKFSNYSSNNNRYSEFYNRNSDTKDYSHRKKHQSLKPILKNLKNTDLQSDGNSNEDSSNTLQLQQPSTIRKKSYNEMSNDELLQLDSQFANKYIDLQKDYRFDSNRRLSAYPVSSGVSSTLSSIPLSYDFKKLSNLKEYPTKPLIKRNSICLVYKHCEHTSDLNNNKYYLILISNKLSSLNSIEYYLKNFAKNGDNVVICSSICSSNFDYNNNNNDNGSNEIDSSILDLVDLILSLFSKCENCPKIQINFEFFRSFNYFNETVSLYQPNMIIVGSNLKKEKSSSISTNFKKLIPIVYTGRLNNDSSNDDTTSTSTTTTTTSANNNHKNNINDAINVDASSTVSPGGITFKIPFIASNTQSQPLPISINRKNSNFTTSTSNSSSNSSLIDSLNLSKTKTNDTAYSSAFEILNDLPKIDDENNNARRNSNLLYPNPNKFKSSLNSTLSISPVENNLKNLQDIEKREMFEKYNRRMSTNKSKVKEKEKEKGDGKSFKIDVTVSPPPKNNDYAIIDDEDDDDDDDHNNSDNNYDRNEDTSKDKKKGFFKRILGRY